MIKLITNYELGITKQRSVKLIKRQF